MLRKKDFKASSANVNLLSERAITVLQMKQAVAGRIVIKV
jgi:hypothetical protein